MKTTKSTFNRDLYENVYRSKFSFGKNWENFLSKLTQEKIDIAKKTLKTFLGVDDLRGKSFIDIGCGSGLHSLAAVLLGADKVVSVDVDSSCLDCTRYLKETYGHPHTDWKVIEGSVLNREVMSNLGKVDIVYSWGVLHHTGDMWTALKNITFPIRDDGYLYLAIYNKFDGFPSSETWLKIKRFYSSSSPVIRKCMEFMMIIKTLSLRLIRFQNPLKYIRDYENTRGMDFYTDIVDWLGGYPYEFASTEEVINFYEDLDFELGKLNQNNGTGCNEFLFRKITNAK